MAAPTPQPGSRRPRTPIVAFIALAFIACAVGVALLASSGPAPQHHRRHTAARVPRTLLPACGAVCAPIDAAYLTDLHFGNTSFWIQPWRAYLDTWPASRLTDALGINFNVPPQRSQEVARVLHEAGFRLARIGLSWGSVSYQDLSRFSNEASIRTRLEALKRWGLRPLILLDANSQAPCPHEGITLELQREAPAGSRTIQLSEASAKLVVPGKTGLGAALFNSGFVKHHKHHHRGRRHHHEHLTRQQRRERHLRRRKELREHGLTTHLLLHGNPAILIASVSANGTATLSRPLPRALEAGPLRAVTLRFAPFQSPRKADGSPNPVFAETLNGWIAYVRTVSRLARSVFGPGGFDLEVWNELSFGSQFLDAGKYYEPAPNGEGRAAKHEIRKAILAGTVRWVRSPASGLSASVGITNGFASQAPFATGAASPPGLTAISKHPYAGMKIYPEDFKIRRGRIPLDAQGQRDTAGPRKSAGALTPLFVPRLRSFYPEFYLGAETPETLVRDISPVPTNIYHAAHGRDVAAPGGRPVQVWLTEYNLGAGGGEVTGPDGYTALPGAPFGPGDVEHFEAKVVLRSLVSMIAKGVAREYFFAAINAGDLGLIPPSWRGGSLAEGAGEALQSLARMLRRFAPSGPPGPVRPLSLTSIVQQGTHAQFEGEGTDAHPSLLDREVLGVFPFQVAPRRYVIPVYVMTRNLKTDYQPDAPAGDRARFDLPPETFDITLGNVPAGSLSVSAYDPITNTTTPVRVTARHAGRLTLSVAATDYPRLLTIDLR